MNSKEIADKYGKEHKHVLNAIRNLLKRNPELCEHFTKSFYYDNKHEKRPVYVFDEYSKTIMENKFKYNVRSARFEYKMLNEICDFLNELHIKYIKQYPILAYKIDLFLPNYNVCIEYDEKAHKFKQEYDRNRENNIIENIGCKFIRIKEDETVGTAIARILEIIGGEIFNAKRVI